MPHLLRRFVDYWPITAVLIGLPIIAAILYGCESRPPVVKRADSDQAGDLCAALLENGIDAVRPDSLGIVSLGSSLRSDPQQAANILSQWLRRPDCLAASPTEPLSDDAKELVRRLLGDEGVEQLTAERLQPFDAAHIRDALLDSGTADALTKGASNDLERVQRVFDFLVRTVTPEGPGSSELLLTGYEAELFGRGSAEARTWLFANLLRQLKIDSIVLRLTDESEQGSSLWWVGVPVGGEVYIFDLVSGIAVPSPAERSGDVATWREVKESPEILTAYREKAGLEPSPITVEGLASATVELIGPRAFWSKSIERLELSLTGDRGVLLYDPLHDTAAGPGLYSRIVRAGEGVWDADAIGIWSYPDEVRAQRDDFSESQRQRLQQRLTPYLGPVRVDPKEATPRAEPPSKQLWRTRLLHMSGEPGAAIASLNQVRLADIDDPALSPGDRSINSQAADEAYYWSIHAQLDAGRPEAAAKTAENYLSESGDRSEEAAMLRALGLAASGQIAAAREALAQVPETAPGRARLQWLSTTWEEKGTAEAESSEPE